MIKTVQDLVPGVDVNALAQDAGNLLGLNQQEQQQATSDAQAMQQQLDTQELPQVEPQNTQAGLSSFLAKQIAKRKELAGVGIKEFEQRQASKISDDVEIKSDILEETKLSDLDSNEPYQINFDTIQDQEDLRKTFGVLNEMNKEAIQTQRRNVVPDDELKGLADDLSSDPVTIKKVLGLKPGEILAPEYILSMKQTLTQSANRLKDLSQKIVSGEATDKDKIAFHKQWEFHSQYTTQFMGVRAEYGRGLRALGLNMESNNADMQELMTRMSAGTLDETTMAQQLLMAADTKSITRVVDAQKKGVFARTGDAFSELFISSILSGVQTHVVNVTSNAMKAISMPLDTAVASMFKANGPDVIGKGEASAQIAGMWQSNIEALNMAFKVLKTGEAYGNIDKLDVDYQKAISANALGIPEGKFASAVDVFGKFVRLSTDNLMGAEDAYFKVLNERGKLRQLAHRKANDQHLSGDEYNNYVAMFMDNPPKDAIKEATQAGLQGTYQQELGKAGKGIQQIRGNIPGGTLIMPFIKTPINLLYEGFVERTPLGLLSKKYKDAMVQGGGAAQMAKAKMAVGTSVNATLLATFWNLEYGSDSKVQVIGSYPADSKARQVMKDAGVQENSIMYIDDNGRKKYISFNRLEPFNSVFKLYANVMQVQKVANLNELDPDLEKEFSKMAAGISLAFAEATVNQTFMKGIKDVLDGLTAGTNVKKIESIMANYTNAMIPHSSALKNITKMFDDQIRDADGILDKVKKNLPILSKDYPPILDNFGKPMTYKDNLVPSFYKPGEEGSNDKVRNEINRLVEATKVVPVYKPKKTLGGYRMTAQEYHDYCSFATHDKVDGKNFYEAIKEAMNTYDYKNSNDQIKVVILDSIRDAYYSYAKEMLKEKYPRIRKYDLDKVEYQNKLLKGEI